MQDLSYIFRNPIFNAAGFKFSIEIFTFENIYGLNESKCHIEDEGDKLKIKCSELVWAGGQETAKGCLEAEVNVNPLSHKILFKIYARCSKTIRCVKLRFIDVPPGTIVNLRESESQEIPQSGLLYKYPEGWRHISTPLIVLKTAEGKFTYFRSLDTIVREKRFALIPRSGKLDVELIFEENATVASNTITVPAWEVGECESVEDVYSSHSKHIETCYGLTPWESRKDVPDWARGISLVASIHCQHWTGYIFNNYEDVLENIRWLSQRIDPRRILAYLPGWEGRYYWKYGNYCADERMGGEKGLRKLIEEAKKIGVHVMLMFGINIVNKGTENYQQWGAPSEAISAGGFKQSGSVDWDSSRHYDHGSGVGLNPAAPGWQNRLVTQITDLIDQYGFDGVFLDISALWFNDPNHYLYDGIVKLVNRIRKGRNNVLVAGEGWYDAMSAITPLVQSGHTDGILHWHDIPHAEMFNKYCRAFGHLCLGDPSRNSTGVHELGYNPITRVPVREGIIPTITIVNDTIKKAPEKVLEIIEDAKEYAARYLGG